ncbi:hypothetical protein JGU71_11460 [Antrihabitans sp. YC3-6]|uniref:Uncharacterized protein n=1 Tax=Antrihabitans stalagmiti TaxID=2799499 RepID=A0A934NQD4_9NOCA|nr:hypothetical protein [Antrihabitans stalagmiti]MBJ8339504.1 hypothetical protein [Antrihabitans stalagmiti]
MSGFSPGLLQTLCLLPVGIGVRIVGIVVGFGLVAMFERTRMRGPAMVVGDAVSTCSLFLALLPVLAVPAGLALGGYRVLFAEGASTGLLLGSLGNAVLLVPYVLIVLFSADQEPSDTA